MYQESSGLKLLQKFLFKYPHLHQHRYNVTQYKYRGSYIHTNEHLKRD